MEFIVKANPGDIERTIKLTSTAPEITRYFGHPFGSPQVTASNTSTLARSTYSFSLSTKDYDIISGCRLTIIFPFPLSLQLDNGIPQITFTNGISPSGNNIYYTYPDLSIVNLPEIIKDTNIEFSITDIINPYTMQTRCIGVDIYHPGIASYLFESLPCQFSISIDNVGGFNSVSLQLAGAKTSELGVYSFSVELGYGSLNTIADIELTVDQAIKDCDETSFQAVSGFTTIIIDKYKITENAFGFVVPCDIAPLSLIVFSFQCTNPETTRRTSNFTITARTHTNNEDIYYFTGESLQINDTNNFISVNYDMSSSIPSYNTAINFTIIKSSPINSTDINRINIKAASALNIYNTIQCNNYFGFTGTPECELIVEENTILIKNFTELNQTFGLKLTGIRTPATSTEPIYFTLKTFNSDNYQSEEITTPNNYLPCDFPCTVCETGEPTKCIQCYPGRYLLNNLTKTCDLVRDFETSSEINITGGDLRIGQKAFYTFKLRPNGTLDKDTGIIEIDVHPVFSLGVNCNVNCTATSNCTCSITGRVISVRSFLDENFDAATTTQFIQFVFYETIGNPLWTYAYDECSGFKVYTLENRIYKHYSKIGIMQTGRYQPFKFTSTSLGLNDSSTSTTVKVSFQIRNAEYAIYKDTVFRIQFPQTVAFDDPPSLTRIAEGLPTDAIIIYNEFPYIMISAHYENDLSSSSLINFEIDNIITPYFLGTSDCIYITTTPDELAESAEINQFAITSPDLCLSINNISPFSATSITTSSYVTSVSSKYIFSATTRSRNLNSSFKINISTPTAISNCYLNSITEVDSTMSTITNKFQCGIHFCFIIPSEIPKLTEFKFYIICDNPETTRPTDCFGLEAVDVSTEEVTYQKSSGLFLTMTVLNQFSSVEISSSNPYPGQLNNYTFSLAKSSQISSVDITIISVYFSPENITMVTQTVSYANVTGIQGESLGFLIQGNMARISKITELSEFFEFTLVGIRNPYTRDELISVVISTSNEDQYYSELVKKDIGNMECNYPCQTCVCQTCSNKDDCISCPPTMYLLNVECVYICPIGHYSNITSNICEDLPDLLGFNYAEVTFINSNSEREINKVSGYRFKLQPKGDLSKDASIEITRPKRMEVGTSCNISGVSGIRCSIINSHIIINDFLESNYISGAGGEIIFDIYVFVNPRWTYTYDTQQFQIVTKHEDAFLHGGALNLTDTGRFIPHQLIVLPITPTSFSTASKVAITINLKNMDYAVDTRDSIYIKFPSSMQFKGTPELTVISGLDSSASITSSIYPDIIIDNILATDLAQGSLISFSISNILTPFIMGTSESIQVVIGDSEDLKQFVATTGLTLSVDTVSTLGSFSVTPSSFVTCERANYIFGIQIGEREVDINYQIRFKMAESVTQCTHSDIYDGLGSTLTEKVDLGGNYFAFRVPAKINAMQTYSFGIQCTNPETVKPTENFHVQIENIATHDPCYNDSGSPVTMTNYGDFDTVDVEFSNQYPASLTNITIIITKTLEATAINANMILIYLSPNFIIDINILGCEFLSGINGDNLSCRYETGDKIIFDGIKEISHTFSITLENIRNPSLSTEDIYISIHTFDIFEYKSEYRRITEHIPCNLPCKTCKEGYSNHCIECFTINDLNYIGDGGINKFMFYESTHECFDECPSHTINTTATLCETCHICSQCSAILTNCTECYQDTYLHNYECINSCPPGYFGNILEWKCEETGIFLEGTRLQIIGDTECEHLGLYLFELMPVGTLDMTSTIEITIPEQMHLERVCIINTGDCTINTSTNTLIITNVLLTSNYDSNSGEYIIVNISNTIHNPSYSVGMDSYSFGLKTITGTVIQHTGNIKSISPGRFTAHAFGAGSSVSCPVQSTVTETTITFTLFTTEYEIDMGCSIYIKFPQMMGFTSPDPEILIHKGLRNSTTYISGVAYPEIYISGGFQSILSPNQEIQFTISNILTPYVKNTQNRFSIAIITQKDINKYIDFDEFEVNITDEAIVPFIVTPSSFMTCRRAIYEFSVGLGDGSLNPAHLVQFEVPESITDCNHSTIIQTQGINSNITTTGFLSPYIFEFWIPIIVEKLTTIKFRIMCNNPESQQYQQIISIF